MARKGRRRVKEKKENKEREIKEEVGESKKEDEEEGTIVCKGGEREGGEGRGVGVR